MGPGAGSNLGSLPDEAPGNAEAPGRAPAEAQPVDSSRPDRVVGDGTKESCSSEAFVSAVARSRITDNQANEGGGAIFFVSKDRSGSLIIRDSELRANPSLGFETEGYPGIFVLASGEPQVQTSVLE